MGRHKYPIIIILLISGGCGALAKPSACTLDKGTLYRQDRLIGRVTVHLLHPFFVPWIKGILSTRCADWGGGWGGYGGVPFKSPFCTLNLLSVLVVVVVVIGGGGGGGGEAPFIDNVG